MLGFLKTDPMPVELDWELWVLDQLEQAVFTELKNRGVPEDQWTYYMGFFKRLWERGVHFTQGTFTEEKEILITEYKLRGWDEATLRAIQGISEFWARVKGAPWLRYPKALFIELWSYGGPPAMTLIFSEPWTYEEPPTLHQILLEPWSPGPPPTLSLLFSEPWSPGPPPTMSLIFSEPWTLAYTLKFSEPWTYSEPPSMTQKFVEPWG